jgi:hypothetical protein
MTLPALGRVGDQDEAGTYNGYLQFCCWLRSSHGLVSARLRAVRGLEMVDVPKSAVTADVL